MKYENDQRCLINLDLSNLDLNKLTNLLFIMEIVAHK